MASLPFGAVNFIIISSSLILKSTAQKVQLWKKPDKKKTCKKLTKITMKSL